MSSKFNQLFALCTFAGITITSVAQDLSVIVTADTALSRDAHFNWSFQSSGGNDVQMGQFACGSYWIAPANGDSGVKVLSLTGKTDDPNWHDFVSCDADPLIESHGLLDGSNHYGNYNAAENIIPNLPLTFTPTTGSCISLVAAMQRNEAETSNGGTSAIVGEVVDAYCVVTILPQPPSNGGSDMIRPNAVGVTKEFLTWDDFDLTRIPAYSFISGKTTAQWQQAQTRWRSSIEVFGPLLTETSPGNWEYFSEGGRAFRAAILIPNYGSGAAKTFNDDLFALFSSQNTLEQKKIGLASMLAYGLDLYHARYDYGSGNRRAWASGAGQRSGQFLPPVLLAALSIDETKADELRKVAITNHGDNTADLGPQELRQITRGVTGVLLWGDGPPYLRNGNTMTDLEWRHWSNMKVSHCFDTDITGLSCTQTKKKTAADPYGYIDGPAEKPGTQYMQVSFGSVRALAAAMILMPNIRSVVNTNDPIEYADRIIRHGIWTYPDPVAPVAVIDQTEACNPYYTQVSGCNEWGVTWGADPSDVRFAIEDGTGRFTSINGNTINPTTSYESPEAKNNWSTIIALYNGETFEDNAVPLGTVVAPRIYLETGATPKVHLQCSTPDAQIRYTLDGPDPTASSTLYTGPISILNGGEVRAKAFLAGKVASAVQVQKFGTDSTPPSVPENLVSVNPTLTSVELNWSPSTDDFSVSGYKIYINGNDPITSGLTSATINGLDPHTTYTLTVSAFDASGNESTQSSSISVTTLSDTTPPSKPIRLGTSSVTATTINLTWFAASDNVEVGSYKVYINGNNPISVNETSTTITGLSPQTLYLFTVSALDTSLNESEQSSSIQAMTSVGTSEPLKWLGYTADANGDANTGDWIGWVNLKMKPWAWNYSLESWIYATGSGPVTSGAWVYIRR